MINGEIPMSSIIQTVDFADDQRRDTDVFYYTDGWLRRWSTARYRCLLLYRRLASPMINGEIPMSSIIQTVRFADDQRRDTDVFYYTDGWLRRWSTARYRCLLLYRRLASPMINGEIPMSSTIQTVDFADDQRRDTDVFYYTDGWLCRWSTARYRCLLLYRRFISPLYNGDISVTFIYRGIHFAVVQRRSFDFFHCNLHIAKLANFYSFCILKQSHNMWKYVHPKLWTPTCLSHGLLFSPCQYGSMLREPMRVSTSAPANFSLRWDRLDFLKVRFRGSPVRRSAHDSVALLVTLSVYIKKTTCGKSIMVYTEM